MRSNTFARSAVLAALTAAGWLAWAGAVAPIAGTRAALTLYLVGATIAYLAAIASRGARQHAIVRGAALFALAVGLAAGSTPELALALAVVVGITRAALFYRGAPARTVATEIALLAGGLLFAAFLSDGSILGSALGIWGFLLVQSLFFLFADSRSREGRPRPDPFEAAYGRAMALLERSSV